MCDAATAAVASSVASVAATTSYVTVASPLHVTLQEGLYTFAMYAVDLAGNAGTTGAPPPPPAAAAAHLSCPPSLTRSPSPHVAGSYAARALPHASWCVPP